MKSKVQDNMPGTDRNRHNQQSTTENVKEVLPGTKEHEGASEGLGHKIAKHIPGCVPYKITCIYVSNMQASKLWSMADRWFSQAWIAVVLPAVVITANDLYWLPAELMPTRSTRTRSEWSLASNFDIIQFWQH